MEKERNIKTGDSNNVLRQIKKINSIEEIINNNNNKPLNVNSKFNVANSPNYFIKKNEYEMIPEVEDDKIYTLYGKTNAQNIQKIDESQNEDRNNNNTFLKNKFQFNEKIFFDKPINQIISNDHIIAVERKYSSKLSNESYVKESKNLFNENYLFNGIDKQKVNSKMKMKSMEDDIICKENINSTNNNINGLRFSMKKTEIVNENFKQTGCFSPNRKQDDIEFDDVIENLFSDGEIESRKKIKNVNENYPRNKINSSKNSVKKEKIDLPIIKSSRPNLSSSKIDKNEISNIFDACNNLKKDPEIKEKLNELLYKIDDLKNVLNLKSNSRFKISSAPLQINNNSNKKFKISNKSTYTINTINTNNNNINDNITFSKFPNFNKNVNNPKSTSLYKKNELNSHPENKVDLIKKPRLSNNSLKTEEKGLQNYSKLTRTLKK